MENMEVGRKKKQTKTPHIHTKINIMFTRKVHPFSSATSRAQIICVHVCAVLCWCTHIIGNISFITKALLASFLHDLVRRDTAVGAAGTAGSLWLPHKLQSDRIFLASTSTAPLSGGGLWDMATGHLHPTSSSLQARLWLVSLFPLNRI